jgi:hypothetical protein
MRMCAALVVAAVLPSAVLADSGALRLRATTALLAPHSVAPQLAGSGGDDAAASLLGGSGYLLAGASLNSLAMLGSVSLAGHADTPSGVAVSLVGGGAALTILAKANARVAGIDRSWSSAAAGSGLGLLTGAALGAFLTLVVEDGPGVNKVAAAIGGFVLGSAVTASLWTLVDRLLLTAPGCREH